MLRNTILVSLALWASTSAALAEFRNTTTPGKATIDLPLALHMQNTGGSDGEGLCVFTAAEMAGRYQNIPATNGLQKYMTSRPGGGYPQKFDAVMAGHCKALGVPVPRYVQSTGGDVAFLELALKTGRPVCVTYGGRDNFYRGTIAHMVVLAHLDATDAAILDNNRPGVWVWMSRQEFLSRWKDQANMGWGIVFLDPPPPAGKIVVVPDEPEVPEAAPLRRPILPLRPRRDTCPDCPTFDNYGITVDAGTKQAPPMRLRDDSGLFHVTIVSGVPLTRVKAVNGLQASGGDFHLQGYGTDAWTVKARRLLPGVTVRRPDGTTVWQSNDLTEAGLADAVKRADPRFVEPVKPEVPAKPDGGCKCGPDCKCKATPAVQPAVPKCDPGAIPADKAGLWGAIVAAITWILTRRTKNDSE